MATCLTGLVPLACAPVEFGDRHAARIERYEPAPFTPDGAEYARADNALGPPDGRTLALGRGAYVILRFFRPPVDGDGADLRVYEIGADGAKARIAFSPDGERFVESTVEAFGPATLYDLADLGLTSAGFVRIRGLDDAGEEPGFDLDAVEGLH